MSKEVIAKWSTLFVVICTTLLATPVITNNVTCPPGWEFWGSNCYYFYSTTFKSWSWDEAQSNCVNQGGYYGYNSTLTSIHSEEENSYIMGGVLGLTPENYPFDVWIGFRLDDAWFYWSDGTEVTYTRWDTQANQPGSGISPNCVVMRLQGIYVGSFGYWYDGYDCETWGSPVTVCKTGTEPVTPPTNDCPLFWFSWGSHCYYFSNRKVDAVQTWYDAQSFCEETAGNNFNSTLASINSREENRYITNTLITLNLIGPYVWIGLSGGTAATPFEQWSDGSDLQYTNWMSGYPSYPADNSSACGYMMVDGNEGSGRWGNIPCDSNGYRTAVCKAPKASI